MARAPKQDKAEPTGTVQARRKNEKQREKAARELRALEAQATLDARKATDKRIKAKPEDSRTLVDPDPTAGIL